MRGNGSDLGREVEKECLGNMGKIGKNGGIGAPKNGNGGLEWWMGR